MKLFCCISLLIVTWTIVQAQHPQTHQYPNNHHQYPNIPHQYPYGGYGGPVQYRYNQGLYQNRLYQYHQYYQQHLLRQQQQHRCHGNTKTCPEGYTFNKVYCGCFKDGDTLPVTPPPKVLPAPLPLPLPLPPPRCPRILPCSVGKVFDESQCQCVCTTQITQCPGATTYNPSQCKCECINRQQCLRYQRFNEYLCICEQVALPQVPIPPAPLPAPGPLPPAPLPPAPLPPAPLPPAQPICPPSAQFRCTRFQTLNQQTCQCECSSLAASRCRQPQILNPDTCQCECSRRTARTCNSNQRFNFENCECECQQVYVTVEIQVPGPLVPGPSIPGPLVPGPAPPAPPAPFFRTRSRSGTPGTRSSKRRKRNVEAHNGHVRGPHGQFRHRRSHSTGSGPGTGPGTFRFPFRPPAPLPPPLVPGPSIPGPLVPGPPRTITERRLTAAPCPAGTFLERRTCECF